MQDTKDLDESCPPLNKADELNKKWQCERGQVWEIEGAGGIHRLMCGDSTQKDDVDKLMRGRKADMVFTDPPYGVSIRDKNKILKAMIKTNHLCTDKNLANDNLNLEALKQLLTKAFVLLKENSNDICSYYVMAPQDGMMLTMMKDVSLSIRHILVWVKNHQCFSFGRLDYEYKHEPILYTWNKSHKFYGKGKYKSSVWEIDKEIKCDKHPTMKPIELIVNAILNSSLKKQLVVDFFLGSGSTMVACEQTQRVCYAMEIEPNYCAVSLERMADLGLKPILL